jgi:transcription factor-like protein
LTNSMQALLFAISLASISSMSEQDVQDNFRDSRTALLGRLSTGAETCLSKADVLNTTDIRLLQALVLYVEAKSQEGANRGLWCLMGMVVRIAMLMGLHRDGSLFNNIAPFDVEMRRRLWWHVCFMDCRSEEAQNTCTQMSVFAIRHDPEVPTNVDDKDLDPQMDTLPVSREGITDASLAIVRYQLWHLSKSVKHTSKQSSQPEQTTQMPTADSPPQPLPEPDSLVASRAKIEDMFFRHTRQDNPRHVFLADVIRHTLAVFELHFHLIQAPPTRTPPADAICPGMNRVFLLAIAVIELSHSLDTSPETSGWYWALRPPVPWRTISALLVHSNKRPWAPTCERAWNCVTSYMANSPTFRASCKKDVLWVPVRKLLGEAAAHRASENQRIQNNPEIARRLRMLESTEPPSSDWLKSPCTRSTFDLDEAERRLSLEMQVSAGNVSPSPPLSANRNPFSLSTPYSDQGPLSTITDFGAGYGDANVIPVDLGWEELLPEGAFPDSAEAWDAWDTMMAG